jgi:hypothetical protein
LMAILCHNHDFGDAWEHLNDPWYPKEISLGHAVTHGGQHRCLRALALGILYVRPLAG